MRITVGTKPGQFGYAPENDVGRYAVQVTAKGPRGHGESRREALFRRLRLTCGVRRDPERTDEAKVHARRWPFLKVPRYSMPHREGAMVRLDIGQGGS